MSFPLVSRALLAVALLAGVATASRAEEASLTIFAAASLKGPLDAAAAKCKAEGDKAPAISYAASSVLMKQIEAGAPADLFASADLDWMDYGAKKHLIKEDTRRNLLGNALVLIAPADSDAKIDLKPGVDLAGAVGDGRIATGEVKSVPAGKYAKASLEKLGIWQAVEPRLAQTENVRAALALVSRGEAKFGIVYASDAKSDPKVKVIATFPEDSHAPIIYPFAVTAASKNPQAAAFLACLASPPVRAIFAEAGFTEPK